MIERGRGGEKIRRMNRAFAPGDVLRVSPVEKRAIAQDHLPDEQAFFVCGKILAERAFDCRRKAIETFPIARRHRLAQDAETIALPESKNVFARTILGKPNTGESRVKIAVLPRGSVALVKFFGSETRDMGIDSSGK